MAKPIVSGIYRILNTRNGKFYIGSAKDIEVRWRTHKSQLRNGKHHSTKLQHSWNKHGQSAFEISVIEEVNEIELLVIREQFYIDELKPWYNIAPVAGSVIGFRHSEESRKKMSESQRKRPPISEETRMLLSESSKRPCREETKRKISQAHTGKRGAVKSAEAREKLSKSLKGKPKPPRSTEHCLKISEANKGRKRTADQVARTTAGNIGKKRSDEVKKILSEKALARDPECYARGAATRALISPKKGVPWTEARREAQNKRQAAT